MSVLCHGMVVSDYDAAKCQPPFLGISQFSARIGTVSKEIGI